MGDFHAKEVDLYLHQQGIDTTTPSGKAMFQMCGVFAEFERGMIQERVKAGLQRAVTSGKRLGRPSVPKMTADKVKQLHKGGMSFRKIAQEVSLHHKTVSRLCA